MEKVKKGYSYEDILPYYMNEKFEIHISTEDGVFISQFKPALVDNFNADDEIVQTYWLHSYKTKSPEDAFKFKRYSLEEMGLAGEAKRIKIEYKIAKSSDEDPDKIIIVEKWAKNITNLSDKFEMLGYEIHIKMDKDKKVSSEVNGHKSYLSQVGPNYFLSFFIPDRSTNIDILPLITNYVPQGSKFYVEAVLYDSNPEFEKKWLNGNKAKEGFRPTLSQTWKEKYAEKRKAALSVEFNQGVNNCLKDIEEEMGLSIKRPYFTVPYYRGCSNFKDENIIEAVLNKASEQGLSITYTKNGYSDRNGIEGYFTIDLIKTYNETGGAV